MRSHFKISPLVIELAEISRFGTHNLELARAEKNVCKVLRKLEVAQTEIDL